MYAYAQKMVLVAPAFQATENLFANQEIYMQRRAKIVATLGPSSQNETVLKHLFNSGVNVVRLNYSHVGQDNYAPLIKLVRKVAGDLNIPICILQDLQGPKNRVGKLPDQDILLEKHQEVRLITKGTPKDNTEIPIEFMELPQFVSSGSRILLDDGSIELEALEIANDAVIAKVIVAGTLKSNKGINLPGVRLDMAGFTEKDARDLKAGLELGVDMVAISFVRSADDIETVRRAIGAPTGNQLPIPIIAKLERPEALENIQEIVEASDGVMVARGDLGVEMPPESVPIAQKQIIDVANKRGKLVITATQMLDSMINNPRPTRAEASDVANAIFDGTDAVMLSGETAIGKYPVETVQMMDAIIAEAESHSKRWGHWKGSTPVSTQDDAISMTRAARELAHDLSVEAITVFTQSGTTARLMSKTLPRVPIYGFTPELATYNRMALYWGVVPYLVDLSNSIEDMLQNVEQRILEQTDLKLGQQVVVISGFPVGEMRAPNIAMLHTLGQFNELNN
jgi:pyruvate kinase